MRIIAILAMLMILFGCTFFQPAEPEKPQVPEQKPLPPPPPPPHPPPVVPNVPVEPPPPPSNDVFRFNVTVQNMHDSYSLSPGVFIVHKKLTSFNYFGKPSPAALEPLAEYGDTLPFAE